MFLHKLAAALVCAASIALSSTPASAETLDQQNACLANIFQVLHNNGGTYFEADVQKAERPAQQAIEESQGLERQGIRTAATAAVHLRAYDIEQQIRGLLELRNKEIAEGKDTALTEISIRAAIGLCKSRPLDVNRDVTTDERAPEEAARARQEEARRRLGQAVTQKEADDEWLKSRLEDCRKDCSWYARILKNLIRRQSPEVAEAAVPPPLPLQLEHGKQSSAEAPQSPPAAEQTRSTRLGPSFDCTTAVRSLGKLICSDLGLSEIDLRFKQTYEALRQQVGEAGQRELREEAADFDEEVRAECGVPDSGQVAGSASSCVREYYLDMRAKWFKRLTGPAREEARRPLEQHVALQHRLQELGYLPGTVKIDGVYRAATHSAIASWQQASGRLSTGFIADGDAVALGHAAETVAAPTPQPALKPLLSGEADSSAATSGQAASGERIPQQRQSTKIDDTAYETGRRAYDKCYAYIMNGGQISQTVMGAGRARLAHEECLKEGRRIEQETRDAQVREVNEQQARAVRQAAYDTAWEKELRSRFEKCNKPIDIPILHEEGVDKDGKWDIEKCRGVQTKLLKKAKNDYLASFAGNSVTMSELELMTFRDRPVGTEVTMRGKYTRAGTDLDFITGRELPLSYSGDLPGAFDWLSAPSEAILIDLSHTVYDDIAPPNRIFKQDLSNCRKQNFSGVAGCDIVVSGFLGRCPVQLTIFSGNSEKSFTCIVALYGRVI
jgi:putative peptidoglycan binding protein